MALLFSLILCTAAPTFSEPPPPQKERSVETALHSLFDSTLYIGATACLGSASLLSGVGWALLHLTPWTAPLGDECLILGASLGISAKQALTRALKISPLFSFLSNAVPPSYSAWEMNQKILSQIPTSNQEERELIDFLSRHWLAKTTGIYPIFANWICPSFELSFPMHPETMSSYARDPGNKFFKTYKNRIEEWKQHLPHPHHFPLILTRPANIKDYLPSYFEVSNIEKIAQLANSTELPSAPLILDFTPILETGQWPGNWDLCQSQLIKEKIDPDKVLCIQRVNQKEMGGIRLLPLQTSSQQKIQRQYEYLLEWISRFGLSANRIELDRAPLSPSFSNQMQTRINFDLPSPEDWSSQLASLEKRWKSVNPQKTLLFQATLQVLKDLCEFTPREKWNASMNCSTRALAAQATFSKIEEQLNLVIEEEEITSFSAMTPRLEEIHADLSSLLEIFNPFTFLDFTSVFQNHLTLIPEQLRPLSQYGIHSSGMTSLAGIFKAVKQMLGREPRILFGENTYFECILASERIGKAVPIESATEEQWEEVDLLLAQFNPVLKRINSHVTDYQATEYHVEKVAQAARRALNAKKEKNLTLAIDCTLDFSNSSRVGLLLLELQEEIQKGDLSIVCYRSGLKFDLFGMDNYCGAPFYMIHNQDPKWSQHNALLTDSALISDRLSLNWFALVYRNSAHYLEAYRKQVFSNTRTLLEKIPTRFFSQGNTRYRIIPIEPGADPSFIDIKIFGPMHAFRAMFVLGGLLTVKCMQAGHTLLSRPGIGFYHPNISVLFGEECSTLRLTLGLDPAQIDVFVNCFTSLDPGTPSQ